MSWNSTLSATLMTLDYIAGTSYLSCENTWKPRCTWYYWAPGLIEHLLLPLPLPHIPVLSYSLWKGTATPKLTYITTLEILGHTSSSVALRKLSYPIRKVRTLVLWPHRNCDWTITTQGHTPAFHKKHWWTVSPAAFPLGKSRNIYCVVVSTF